MCNCAPKCTVCNCSIQPGDNLLVSVTYEVKVNLTKGTNKAKLSAKIIKHLEDVYLYVSDNGKEYLLIESTTVNINQLQCN